MSALRAAGQSVRTTLAYLCAFIGRHPETITLAAGCVFSLAGCAWVSRWERNLERDHLNADAETRVASIKYELETEFQRLMQQGNELLHTRAASDQPPAAQSAYYWIAPLPSGAIELPARLAGTIAVSPQSGIAGALARTRDSGYPSLSRRLPMPAKSSTGIAVLAVAAVYTSGKPPHTVEERRRLLRGYVATILDPAELLERSSHPHADRMAVRLTDRRALPGESHLAYREPAARGGRSEDGPVRHNEGSRVPRYTVLLPVGDSEWEVVCSATSPQGRFIHGWQAWGALIFGLTFTFSITALVHLLSTRAHRVELLVEQRTSELQERNQELIAAHARALESSRLKSQFLANMSHEIRTPMNGIIGFTQLALSTELTADQRDYLETVEGSAELMMQIINDILDFSKIEAGRLDLEQAPFSLRACLKLAVDSMSVAAAQKGLRLAWEIDPSSPDTVVGDAYRLRQVLLNLIGNSIKFTSAGEVRVIVSSAPESESTLTAHFMVRDTGIGIPDCVQKLIFEPFRQADGSTTRKYGGTGLGLAISARLVEMMHGHIWVESTEGEGSTFHFTILLDLSPMASLPLKCTSPAGANDQPPLHILLAEDNVVSRELVTALLRQRGHQVEVAATGREAVEAHARRLFDLILMDVQMPEMDGLEATAEIRMRERETGRHTAIVALTAHAMNGDRERCLIAGMDEYLSKPVRANELMAFISGIAAKRGMVQR